MYKLLFVLMLLLSASFVFAQEAESFDISDELSDPIAFNTQSGSAGSVTYPEVIPSGDLPQGDIVGKPVDYATDYYTQYQDRDLTTTLLWTGVSLCVLACSVYLLLYALS